MTAGVPGTGISGLYYVLLVCWMPVREAWLLLRGRSSFARWRFIAGQVAIVAAIVAALCAEGLVIERVAAALASPAAEAGEAGPAEGASVIGHLAPTLFVLTPWLMLLAVVLSTQILARVVPVVEASRPRRRVAPALPAGD